MGSVKQKSVCWQCGKKLARRAGGGYYFSIVGERRVHKACLGEAEFLPITAQPVDTEESDDYDDDIRLYESLTGKRIGFK